MTKKLLLAFVAFVALLSSSAVFAEGKDIAKVGSDAVIAEGETVDNVAVVFGDLTVNGTINEDVAVVGGDLTIGATGKILGDTTVVLGEIIKSEGAEIGQSIVEVPASKSVKKINILFPILGLFALGVIALVFLVSIIIIILLLAYLFTNRVGSASYYVQSYPWKSFLYGFLALLLIVPSIMILLFSVVGIPLIPIFVIFVFVVVLFSYAVMCQLIGLKFFNMIKKPNQHILWEVFMGFVILMLAIMIPYVGWLIKTIVLMFGIGATLATKFGNKWSC